jgi:prolyl-tRNA synthetase
LSDEKGILWPKSVTPFQVHLLTLGTDDQSRLEAEKLYEAMREAGITVLFDDRDERAGAKFNDSDLIGIPLRLVVSSRTLEKQSVEWKDRSAKDAEIVKIDGLIKIIQLFYS